MRCEPFPGHGHAVRRWVAAVVECPDRALGGHQNAKVGPVEGAKTRNLVRDPRAVMHEVGPDFWSYASVTCSAQAGPMSLEAGDQAGQDLLAVHDAISEAPHPDPPEFYDAMVREHRLVLLLRADTVAGMGWTGGL